MELLLFLSVDSVSHFHNTAFIEYFYVFKKILWIILKD